MGKWIEETILKGEWPKIYVEMLKIQGYKWNANQYDIDISPHCSQNGYH
jgi:hypothetical protein